MAEQSLASHKGVNDATCTIDHVYLDKNREEATAEALNDPDTRARAQQSLKNALEQEQAKNAPNTDATPPTALQLWKQDQDSEREVLIMELYTPATSGSVRHTIHKIAGISVCYLRRCHRLYI